MDQQITEVCENCLKSFPQSKIATHFGYCRRNIKKCDKCGQMYDINFLEEHEQEFHKLSKCNYCKKQFQPHDIKGHEKNCEAKTQYCQYCDLDVPLKQYGVHLKACEARTKPCQKCKKGISNKQYLAHLVSCQGFIQESTSSPGSSDQYSNYRQFIQKNRNDAGKNNKPDIKQQLPNKYQQQKRYQKKAQYSNPTYTNISHKERKPEVPAYENTNTYGIKKPVQKPREEIKYPQRQQQKNNNRVGLKQTTGPVRDIKGSSSNQIPSNKNKFESYGTSNNPITIDNRNKLENRVPPVNINGNRAQIKRVQQKRAQKIITGPQYEYNKNKPGVRPVEQNNKNFNKRNELGSKKDIPIINNDRKKPKNQGIQNTFSPQLRFESQNYQNQYLNEYNHVDNNFQLQGEDHELQKAIMMSMGSVAQGSTGGYKSPTRGTKKAQKIDDVKPQQLDMMNQSFYDKQRAIYQEFQKKRKK